MKILKIIFAFLACVALIPLVTPLIGSHCDYDVQTVVNYLTLNAESRSKNCCAWYVMRAMHKGGCPIYILPAYGYSWLLPQFGFVEVDNNLYKPKEGDVAVFPAVKGHVWGHIQMWNGKQWVSDFKQKGFYAAGGYVNSKYKIFRRTE